MKTVNKTVVVFTFIGGFYKLQKNVQVKFDLVYVEMLHIKPAISLFALSKGNWIELNMLTEYSSTEQESTPWHPTTATAVCHLQYYIYSNHPKNANGLCHKYFCINTFRG